MKTINKEVDCAICGTSGNYSVLYEQNYQEQDINVDTFSARRMPDKVHYRLVKCNGCGLVRSTPVMSTSALNDLYRKSKLNYSQEVDNLKTTYIKSLSPILKNLKKNAVIFEVGCGNGFILQEIKKLGYKNVFGFEPSVDAVKKAEPSIASRIVNDYFKKNILKKECVDLIVIFQTLDHIPDPNAFLQECYRILKKGGIIFAYNHNVESLTAKILGEKSPIFDIEHTFLYSKSTIGKIFTKNGFVVQNIKFPWNTLSLRHLIWLFPIPTKIKSFIVKMNSPFLNTNFDIPLGNLSIEAKKDEI